MAMPVNLTASLNALATFTASWPMAPSATRMTSSGLIRALSSLISSISGSSICKRPAVSKMMRSLPFLIALSSPAWPIFGTSFEVRSA